MCECVCVCMCMVMHTHVCLCVVRGLQGDLWNQNIHLCLCCIFHFHLPPNPLFFTSQITGKQLPDNSGEFVLQAPPQEEANAIQQCPSPDSQRREADWSSWGPPYTPQLQPAVTKEASARCTDMGSLLPS